MEKLLVVWIDQTSQSIPSSQSLTQSKALTLFSSVRGEQGVEAAEEKLEDAEVGFMRFKERRCLHNKSVKGKLSRNLA